MITLGVRDLAASVKFYEQGLDAAKEARVPGKEIGLKRLLCVSIQITINYD